MTARPQIVLAGNPNVGKTTLFNALTGLSAKVSNYPGITVERRTGTLALPGDRTADVHDVPGTYSLNARSAEEQIAFDAIVGIGEPAPDVVVICADATQVARSLYLLLQCQELGARCVVALTMVDEAKTATPDPAALSKLLECEVVAVTARTKSGLPDLVSAIDRAMRTDGRARWRWQPSRSLQAALDRVRPAVVDAWSSAHGAIAAAGATARGATDIAARAATDIARGAHSAARDATDTAARGATNTGAAGVTARGATDTVARAEIDSNPNAVDVPREAGRAPPSQEPLANDVIPLTDKPRLGFGDALALWALTCVEPRTGGPDDDELDIPDALRAAATDKGDLDLDNPILARWAWLDAEIPKLLRKKPDRSRTQRIDRVLMHRVFGFAVFLAVMAVMFMTLFAWSEPLIDSVDRLFKFFGNELRGALGEGIFVDFLVDGVIAGVGAVMVFLPQILLLFLFLGFLEDCGYLARVAYLMDRIMRTMNLHGRAFVPMLSGFACAVPAIMATRTMERRRDRILTMMVVPLMTCSARLPVYTLVIGTLISGDAVVGGLMMVGMYLFSVVTALAAAWVMSKTVTQLKAKRLPFLIELPPYRWPRWTGVLRMMWSKSSMFLREAGTVILACSIALWALLAFPRDLPEGAPDFDAQIEKAPTKADKDTLENAKKAMLLEHSYGGRLGHAIEPAIAPLGFDWKIGVGIIGAFAAREVFVSTLGIVYSVGGDADEGSQPLRDALRNEKRADGKRAYTPLVGISLMIFFALACQCMSTLAVVRRETRSWRWPLFLFAYMTVLAWIASFAVYQVGRLLGYA